MVDEQKSRMDVIEQGAENIRQSNLLSDTFASIALQDIGACQYVIRTILGIDDLEVIEAKGQYRLLNLTAKDAILDVLAQDSKGRMANIEIQRRDTVDHARRTRYYGSMIDKSILDKGAGHEELPDVYIIYISETDLWHAGETVYEVNKSLGKSGIPYDDGNHVVFVNAAVDDGSEVARMMKYFKTADPDDMSHGDLSKRVNYLKCDKGGFEIMCEAAEKIYIQAEAKGRDEGRVEEAKETARRMHQKGYAVSVIADMLNRSEAQVEEWLGLVMA